MGHAEVESFQAELAKRVPKHRSNTAALVVVGMQTVRSTILERKLGFLQKVLNACSKRVSGRLVEAMCETSGMEEKVER